MALSETLNASLCPSAGVPIVLARLKRQPVDPRRASRSGFESNLPDGDEARSGLDGVDFVAVEEIVELSEARCCPNFSLLAVARVPALGPVRHQIHHNGVFAEPDCAPQQVQIH